MPPQISETQFYAKIIGLLAPWFLVAVYFCARVIVKGKRFMIGAQLSEVDMVDQHVLKLAELQSGPWQVNAEKTINYAAVSLTSVLLAAVFIFEQRMVAYDALIFQIILGICSISSLAYFAALRFWFLALDAGGSVYTRIQYRRIATTFQTMGWATLQLAANLAVLAVNTTIGYIVAFVGVTMLIIALEYEYRVVIADYIRETGLNDFQERLELTGIYEKHETQTLPLVFLDRDYLRVMNWNIERGFHPDALARYINELSPDIVCLQEVDWGCERTSKRDVLDYLAQKTGMYGLFSTEFFEIQDPHRTARSAGGGVHGNAILSRLPIKSSFRIELPVMYDWQNPPKGLKIFAVMERRIGSRFVLCADIEFAGQTLTVCSAHFEDKGGSVEGRRLQLQQIIEHLDHRNSSNSRVIAGDLNTAANWFTNITRYTKRPDNTPRTLRECEWWKNTILPDTDYYDPFSCKEWTYKFGPFYRGKLDWILMDRSIETLQCGTGDFHTSDHRPVWVDMRIPG